MCSRLLSFLKDWWNSKNQQVFCSIDNSSSSSKITFPRISPFFSLLLSFSMAIFSHFPPLESVKSHPPLSLLFWPPTSSSSAFPFFAGSNKSPFFVAVVAVIASDSQAVWSERVQEEGCCLDWKQQKKVRITRGGDSESVNSSIYRQCPSFVTQKWLDKG